MEEKLKNGEVTAKNEIITKPIENVFVWHENITDIDLSGKNIAALDDKVMLPTNLVHLNLSHNNLIEVPNVILVLEKLVVLNLSHNRIEFFNNCPKFCHTLKSLDMSHNHMKSPPIWVWTESPENLSQLKLSNNRNITAVFFNGFYEQLLQYNTLVTDVEIDNCKLNIFLCLLGTFPKAKSLHLGTENYTTAANSVIEIPCDGLEKCCDLINLKVCNTNIYTLNPSIEMYKNLVELNLAQNNLNSLPNEFCNLESLEICVLAFNRILYLPDNMHMMHKLCRLHLQSNVLCMLPETLGQLSNLKTLDLYDNNLDDVPDFKNLEEIDLALNYFEEPDDGAYLIKKEKCRLLHKNRCNGRKSVITKSHSKSSERSSEYEDDLEELTDNVCNEPPNAYPPSCPEDWDADWDSDWWDGDGLDVRSPAYNSSSHWISYVQQKMKEGNFCPIDNHVASVEEILRHKRLTNPQVFEEVEGQFDDCSSDDA